MLTLQELIQGNATGTDEINNRVLRELSNELSQPLCELFNCYLVSGIFHATWKDANINPLETGNPCNIANYSVTNFSFKFR